MNKLFIYKSWLLISVLLCFISTYAQGTDINSVLLKDINFQIKSEKEINVILTFNQTNSTNNLSKSTPLALPVPLINKQNNLLKISFSNTHIKLDNNVIKINHDLLTDVKIIDLNSKLDLMFNVKQGSFYTLNQKPDGYVITVLAKEKIDKIAKEEVKKPDLAVSRSGEASDNNDNGNTIDKNQSLDDLVKKIDSINKQVATPKVCLSKDKQIKSQNQDLKDKDKDQVKLTEIVKEKLKTPVEKLNFDSKIIPKTIVKSVIKSVDQKEQKVNFSNGPTILNNVDFSLGNDKSGKIIIGFSNNKIAIAVDDSKNQQKQLKVVFDNIILPDNFNKVFDVSDYGTVVKQLSWRKDPQLNTATLVINNSDPVDYVSYQVNNQIIIEIKDKLEANSGSLLLNKEYSGKKISLNFQNIELRSVLQLIADFTDLNLVASDTVQGILSLRLMNVPWDQALDIVLKTKNLDKRKYGNILMVAPTTEIFELEKAELESDRLVEKLINLETEYYHINYAKAEDLAALINSGSRGSMLSERGKASFDKRTNLLIVQDTPSKLKEITKVLKKLDSPVKQVLIEARIVKADTNFQKELGVRWGLSAKRTSNNYQIGVGDTSPNAVKALTPTPGGVVVPKDAAAIATAGGDSGFNIDLGLSDYSGIIGLALAKLPSNTLVHLELSALESEGLVETISSPKIITANKVAAKIEQGQEIPYQESTSSGAASIAFKKAVLSLLVTPQITPDSKIIMDIKVTNDSPRASTLVSTNVPVIDTQNVETQVLVDNSQTVVLGGIFTQNLTNNVERIPFLGELPIVGQLFRKNTMVDNRSEFLIFITPKIVIENS